MDRNFKSFFQSAIISGDLLIPSRETERNLTTSIYFLLKKGQISHFHVLTSDEIWYYHYGSPIIIHIIDSNGDYSSIKLGANLLNHENFQVIIKAGSKFAAEIMEDINYDSKEDSIPFSLVSCVVTPGFNFKDFSIPKRQDLIEKYPKHEKLIKKFTKN